MSREKQIPYTLGARLKQARSAAGLSQRQLGILAGIDPSVASTRINRYELGVHVPDISIAHALAEVLKVPSAFFYAVEDDLAEFLFRIGQLRVSERKELYRSLSHLKGPPLAEP
jgi:transcriptional regulator with XRE-family HTH domain